MEYGLIGAKLGHSYSKIIHEAVCGYSYELHPLPTEEEARAFMQAKAFKAINVTIPYKKLVIPYCDEVEPRAAAIGAVNTVVNRDGKLYGYNTDYTGFAYLARCHGVKFAGAVVLVLGTGGTHNTTWAVAHDRGAKQIYTVSRHPDPEKGELTYAQALTTGAQIIINTTPVGMYPNVGVSALDITSMPGLEAVIDVIYNPDKTELILRAEELGVPVAVGGLEMLVAQAVYAAEFFLDRKFEDAGAEIARVTSELRREQLNIALIGMPSSGKSTLGRALAERLGKRFVDLDEEIVKADGRSIPDIFAAEGEAGFRKLEAAQTARFARENRQVISCGGGVVKDPANLRALHANGIVLFIDRPLEDLLVGGGRPLSTSPEALKTMEAQRRPLYLAAADAVIPNKTTPADAVTAAMEALDEIFSH
jgi:shikimate dehydrogenase